MKNITEILLIILLVFFISPAYAEVNLRVTVEGVEGDIEKNVRAFLSIVMHLARKNR